MRPHIFRKARRQAAAVGMLLAMALGAAVTPASAIPPQDVPPIGADAGRFNLPIACTISLGNIPLIQLPLNVDIQGVAPASLGPGQQFYLTEGSGSMTFPSWLTSLAPILGLTSADATVQQMNVGATNSTPARINIAQDPIHINGIPITAGKPLTVGLPAQGTFTVGPFTAPSSGSTTLQFAGAVVDVTLKSSAGFTLPIVADCKASGAGALLTMAVGGPAGQPAAEYTGAPMHFPAVDTGMQVGTITSPYTCTLNGVPFNVGIAVNGTLPLTASRTNGVTISTASGALVIPAPTVNQLIDRGYQSASGTVTSLNLDADNATPASQNVIPAAGLPIPTTSLTRDTPITVPLPQSGTLDVSAFKPTSSASSMTLSLGSASADLQFNGASGTQTATCAAPSPKVIITEFPVS